MNQPMQPSSKPEKRKLSRRRKLLFAMVPVTVLLLIGEFLARRYRAGTGYAPVGGHSYRDNRIDLIRRAFPAVHDPVLGYRPKPDYASDDNVWQTQVTIDGDGLRTNGRERGVGGASAQRVLAVGDSFTFGDQVSDGETWPAYLEEMLQRPVLNGGVFGYSFGQTVLRAEALLERHEVAVVVCSLIPDDIKRCEMSRRFTWKPWFDLVDGELQLRGVPVVDSTKDNALDEQYLRKLMGYSAMLDIVFWNVAKEWWVGQERIVRVHPEGKGIAICKALLERLQKKCDAKGVRLVLVLQGHRAEVEEGPPTRATELLAHGETLGVTTLDLATRFVGMKRKDRSLQKKFFRGHMSPVGNRWVAEQIAAVLR